MATEPGGHEPAKLASETANGRGRVPADTLANRLVLARRLNGWTIREAAAACGLNYGSWSNWENGSRPADVVEVCQAAATGLDVDFNWLLLGGPLEESRGRRVRPAPERGSGGYDGVSVPGRLAITTRPIGRVDQRGPTGHPTGRRPVRVGRPDTLMIDREG